LELELEVEELDLIRWVDELYGTWSSLESEATETELFGSDLLAFRGLFRGEFGLVEDLITDVDASPEPFS